MNVHYGDKLVLSHGSVGRGKQHTLAIMLREVTVGWEGPGWDSANRWDAWLDDVVLGDAL